MELAMNILCASGDTYLFYLGQAGYVVKSKKNKLLGVDLYLSDCVERLEGHIGFKRMLPKVLSPFDIKFDCLIATHPHLDHFDMDSIPELMSNRSTQLYCSLQCEKITKRLSMKQDNIHYISPQEHADVEDFQIDFVECDHGESAPDAVGIIISVDDKKIYIAGDTCLRMDRVEKLKEKGPFDVIIGPINGAYGNMNEEEFAIYSAMIDAKIVVPCHYGMFASHGGNPGLFLKKMKELGIEEKAYIMTVGEMVAI